MLGARTVTWSKFNADDPQFRSDLWTHLALCSVRVNWHTFYMDGKTNFIMLKTLSARANRPRDLCTPVKDGMIFEVLIVSPDTWRDPWKWRQQVTPLLPWKSNKYYIFCVCNLSYPACNARTPLYTVISGLSGSTTFFHIISYTARFSRKKKVTEHKMCVFWFSLQLLTETFLILRRIQRDIVTNIHRSSSKVPIILLRFW
jgi:hypothetical protein